MGYFSHRHARASLKLGITCSSVATLLAVGYGCGDRYAVGGAQEEATETGALRLALQTDGARPYRLVEAVFEIQDEAGHNVAFLESDADAGGTVLQADLPQGLYTITLRGGWRLEDFSGETVQAALLTENPSTFTIKHDHLTELAYVFATANGGVTLGEGKVELGVDVVNAKTLSDCDLLDGASCGEGLTCLIADDDGETFCAVPGDLAVGEPCDADQCVAGAQCLSTGADGSSDGGTDRVCTQFCDPHVAFPSCECRSLSFDDDVGICVGPPLCEPYCDVAQTFSFTDTFYYTDDIAADALYQFIAGLEGVTDESYIRFEIMTPDGVGGGAWCATNAAFYVSSYLAFGDYPYGFAVSGAWEHYYRRPGEAWVGPVYEGYANYYGFNNCSSLGWCSESGFGGLYLSVYPASTAYDYETSAAINGSVLTISVAQSRLTACGF